jgi:hypothetical protein
MHIGILNTPRFRNTRNQQEIACLEARQKPNVKNTLNHSANISRSSYLQSAYNSHRFQSKISVRKHNTCNFDSSNCGIFPYPTTQIPTKTNQFGVFIGGSGRMLRNF